MSTPKRSPNTERAAECQRIVDELRTFDEDMNEKELRFVADMDDRLTKYGEGTYISDDQFQWLADIYHRVIG